MSTKQKVILGGSLIGLALAVWLVSLALRPEIEILDDRFHFTAYKISRGKKHTLNYYVGNQVIGKLRTQLRPIGIPIKKGIGSSVSFDTPTDSYLFMVLFRADFEVEGLGTTWLKLKDEGEMWVSLNL